MSDGEPVKALRKQAEKAAAVAARTVDPDHAESMRALADAFRAQADAIKALGKTPGRKPNKPEK